MSDVPSRHPKAVVALGMLFLMLTLWAAATWPSESKAYTVSNYCDGQSLGPYSGCQGAERTLYAVEGWGEYSVCVYTTGSSEIGRECTSGTEHIYDPVGERTAHPGITNNTANHTQTVHGRAYQP